MHIFAAVDIILQPLYVFRGPQWFWEVLTADPILVGGWRGGDAALASLVISYVEHPLQVLREVHRILKPGGRLVVSSLCRDADISKIYVESSTELRAGTALETFGEDGARTLEATQRSFLNEAAKILDLEETGAFRFWDAAELEQLVMLAGFASVSTRLEFGDPPQAVVLSAERA